MAAAVEFAGAPSAATDDCSQTLSPVGNSSKLFLSFKVDCDRPARVTILYGVTRRTLSLTGVTTQVAFHAATPSILLEPGLDQRITPHTVAAACKAAGPSAGYSLQDWCWDCFQVCGSRRSRREGLIGGDELQPPPLPVEDASGEAARLSGNGQPDTPLGKFTDHISAALVLLESGEGLQWDSGSIVSTPLRPLEGSTGGLRISGLQRIQDSILRVLPCAPPLGSPLQVQGTSVKCSPRVLPQGEAQGDSTPHSENPLDATHAVDVDLSQQWRFSCSVLEQQLQVEGQCFQLQEIYGMDALQKGSQQEGEALADDALCLICLTEARSVMMLPCRHVCLCSGCAQEMRGHSNFNCPVCRADVHTLMQIRQAPSASSAAAAAAGDKAPPTTAAVDSSLPGQAVATGEGAAAAAATDPSGPPVEQDSAV